MEISDIKFKVWSNIFFLIPVFLSIYYGIYIHALLVFGVMFFSITFHETNERKWGNLDKAFARTLIALNLYLLYLSDFRQPFFSLALFLVVIGFYFYFKGDKYKHDFNHSMWHICSAGITMMCILAYSGSQI